MPNLEITATGNVSGAVTALEKLDKSIVDVVKDTNTIPPVMAKVQTELAKTATSAVKLDSALEKTATTLGTGLKNGSNQATNALTNFGRIVQDAPFGIIGITNNINPMLESFQRLKAETGSTGGAIKSLVGGLMGGGGLGLAISAVTSLLTVYALNNRSGAAAMSESEKAAKKLQETLKENADAYQQNVAGIAKEVATVEILVNALKNENLNRQQRANAIEQLQKASPQYFATLNTEKATIDQISAAYEAYSRSIIRSIELKTREGQLNKVIEERLTLQDKGNKSANITVDANGKIQKSYNAILQEQDDVSKKGFNALILTQREQQRLNELLQTEAELLRQIGNLTDASKFNAVIKPKKVKVEKDDFKNTLKEMRDVLNLDPPLSLATPEMEINLKFKSVKIDEAQQKKVLDALNKMLFNEKIAAAIEASIDTLINDTITNVAGAVADALSGGKDTVPRLFDGIMTGIGQQLKELGKYLVKIGLEKVAIDKAIKALGFTGYGAIAAGIAAQVLGALLISAAQKKSSQIGFASGGTVSQSGFYNVGERGQERIFLPQGAKVQPNNEVMAYGGGGMGMVIAETRISGPDLVILMRRGEQVLGRNN